MDCISNVINQALFYKCLELKAEIEKLRAAQRNSQNIDPERYRLCRQEIASLRMKLHQQERDMANMQRWALGPRQSDPVLPGLPGLVGVGGGPAGRHPSLPYEWSSSSPDHDV